MKPGPRYILASSSPRRIQLLGDLGIHVEARSPDVDESPLRRETPRALVARLSLSKARSVLSFEELVGDATGRDLVTIAADTIVVAPDGKKILGKPRDAADACRMLRSLAGKVHTVFTGYTILCVTPRGKLENLTRVVRSRVKMRSLSASDITAYVSTREPMDKAGSYAAQGIGMALIERISGSYSNVVGLPVCQLVADLEGRFGHHVIRSLAP